jgi:phosphoribosylformylglycinamidine cyclo-ligase
VLERGLLSGMAHVTGGGILGNLQRILPPNTQPLLRWQSWTVPPLFQLIQRAGDIPTEEMRRVFNLGIGMVLVVPPEHVAEVLTLCTEDSPRVIGEVISA